MNLFLYPDFDHVWKDGDRVIIEQTVIPYNGGPALVVSNVILVPAGAEKGRPVVFTDADPPISLQLQTDERGT